MPPVPVTRISLISALRQDLRWEEFVALYGPLILAWARRWVNSTDADVLRQNVLVKVWRGISTYDSAKGPFHSWLYKCTRNAMLDMVPPKPPVPPLPETAVEAPPPEPWELATGVEEYLGIVERAGFNGEGLEQAVKEVRSRVTPTNWKAFLLFVFLDVSAVDIADRLGLTPGAVHQAVYRIKKLLRQSLENQK